MLSALGLWVTFGLVFTGIGATLTRASLWRAFWYGWLLTIVTGQIWNLLAPWNSLAQISVFSVGVWGIWHNRHWLRQQLQTSQAALLVLLVIWVLLANGAVGAQSQESVGFDTGLYHTQSVRWIQGYAAVPGLGNLHERLAFNNAFAFYPALQMSGGYHATGYGLAYGLLFGVAVAGFADSILRRVKHWPIAVILLVLTGFECVVAPINGLMTDPAIWLLGALLFWEVLQDTPDRRFIWLLAGVMIAIKLSAVVIALGLAVLTLRKRKLEWAMVWSFSALIPATLRSIIVSGYAVFPIAITRIPTPWTMPMERVQHTADWIASWAKTSTAPPDVVLNNPNWIQDYFIWRSVHGVSILLYWLPVMMTLVIGLYLIRQHNPIRWRLLSIVLMATVYWFLTAPNIRFAGVVLWLIPLTLSLSLVRPLRIWTPALVLFVVVTVVRWPIHAPGEPLPTLPTQARYEAGIFTAQAQGQCWDAPLPCRPGNKALPQWGEPGNVAAGFVF